MGVFTNFTRKKKLKPGDHIYCWRNGFTYAHHGIYMGDDIVIHFSRGHSDSETVPFSSISSSSMPRSSGEKCDCGLSKEDSGVVRSCFECFLAGCGRVSRFEYGMSTLGFLAKVRGGTCTLAPADPVEDVLHRAQYLHDNKGFGSYDLFRDNCEDFAMYCKTGRAAIVNNCFKGGSGQVASIGGASCAATVCYRLTFMSPLGMAAVSAAVYSYYRYQADIGNQNDAHKIAVEDLNRINWAG